MYQGEFPGVTRSLIPAYRIVTSGAFSFTCFVYRLGNRARMALNHSHQTGTQMLWTIIIILLILWLLGFLAFDLGAIIHILLVIAVIVLIVRLIQGRRVV